MLRPALNWIPGYINAHSIITSFFPFDCPADRYFPFDDELRWEKDRLNSSLLSKNLMQRWKMHFGPEQKKVTMHINASWDSSKLLLCSKSNIDLYKKFTLHSSRLWIIHLFGFSMPVFLSRALLSHVNTAQVVHPTALRPHNVFRARLPCWMSGCLAACIKAGEKKGKRVYSINNSAAFLCVTKERWKQGFQVLDTMSFFYFFFFFITVAQHLW